MSDAAGREDLQKQYALMKARRTSGVGTVPSLDLKAGLSSQYTPVTTPVPTNIDAVRLNVGLSPLKTLSPTSALRTSLGIQQGWTSPTEVTPP